MTSTFQRRALALLASAMPFVVILSPACRSIVGIPGGDIIIAGTGGSGGGQGGHGGSGKGGDGGGGPALSCDSYCNTVQAGCTGVDAVYFSLDACTKLCPFMTLGDVNDQMKNTVGCKQVLGELAKSNGDVEGCKGAGPAGNGLCGTNCESYCSLLGAICPNELTSHFGTAEQCLMDCKNIPDTMTYTAVDNTLPTDDSIQCRIRHLNSAAIGAASTHCMHAVGVGQCPLVTDGGTGDGGDGG